MAKSENNLTRETSLVLEHQRTDSGEPSLVNRRLTIGEEGALIMARTAQETRRQRHYDPLAFTKVQPGVSPSFAPIASPIEDSSLH